jgi:hypothetical protein
MVAASVTSQWPSSSASSSLASDPLLQRVALPGQRDLRARGAAGFRNPPGDRAVVGDAENDPALALHQT